MARHVVGSLAERTRSRARVRIFPTTQAVAPPVPVLHTLVLPSVALSVEDESGDIELVTTGFDQAGAPYPVGVLTPHTSDADVATVSIDDDTLVVHPLAPGSCEVYVTNGAVESNHVALTVSLPTGLIPFRREVLGLELIPALDDANLTASSGQPFVKVGTPTKVVGQSAYDFGTGDALVFDIADVGDLFNANPAGFTVFVALAPIAAPLGTDGLNRTLLTYTNQDTDWPVGMAVKEANGLRAGAGAVAYDAVDYEGPTNAGDPPPIADAAQVYAMRFTRADDVAPETFAFDDPDADRGRLDHFADGVEVPGDGFGPAAPGAAALAGTIATAAGGSIFIGEETNSGEPYPRTGGVWIYFDALSNEEIADISEWIATNYPLSAITP